MWIAFGLSLLGLIVIYLEFFLPGGLIAVLGGLMIGAGIVYFSILEVPLLHKIAYFILNIAATVVVCRSALWVIKNRQRENFFLGTDQAEFVASSIDNELIGQIGEAASDLKPSGHIVIDQKRLQALSESEYIAKGKKIVIIGGRGAYFIVKESV